MASTEERVIRLEENVLDLSRGLTEVRDSIRHLEQRFDSRFENLDGRFVSLENRFDARFDTLEQRFNMMLNVQVATLYRAPY